MLMASLGAFGVGGFPVSSGDFGFFTRPLYLFAGATAEIQAPVKTMWAPTRTLVQARKLVPLFILAAASALPAVWRNSTGALENGSGAREYGRESGARKMEAHARERRGGVLGSKEGIQHTRSTCSVCVGMRQVGNYHKLINVLSAVLSGQANLAADVLLPLKNMQNHRIAPQCFRAVWNARHQSVQ